MKKLHLNTDQPQSLEPYEPLASDTPPKIRVSITRYPRHKLVLSYRLEHAAGSVIWPDHLSMTHPRADNLWERTCMEAFIRQQGHAAYIELNFSPRGLWNAYRFDHYRQPNQMPPIHENGVILTALQISHHSLEATIDLSALFPSDEILQIGMCAVLEHPQRTLSYWALQHSQDQADFHQADDWIWPITLLS